MLRILVRWRRGCGGGDGGDGLGLKVGVKRGSGVTAQYNIPIHTSHTKKKTKYIIHVAARSNMFSQLDALKFLFMCRGGG
jgi:hypothetical protein